MSEQFEKATRSPQDGSSEEDVVKIENVAATRTVDKATERRLMRKLDLRIVPMVMWMYLMSFMDRVIIGNARLYGMEEDLGLGPNEFQLAVSILFVTYCLFEVPSNLIIKRLKPAWFLAGLTLAWGLVATCTALVQNLAGLIACRLLLGLFEAGFFPGVIIYLNLFYNKSNIALRTGYFFSASAISSMVGGLVAYGIGEGLDGASGWRAWRWIILINGVPTIITGMIVPFILPNSIETAKFLTPQERDDLLAIRAAEVGQTKSAQELQWSDVREGVKDWKSYTYGICQFCSNLMLYSFSVFLPTIINELGTFSRAQAQALTAPVFATGAICYLAVSRLSDALQLRGPLVVVAQFVSLIGYAMLLSNSGPSVSFAGTFVVAAGCYIANGLPVAWLATNNPRYGKKALASGMQLSMGNSAGIAAPFLFSSGTGPEYVPGYATLVGTTALAASLFTLLDFWYARQNQARREGKHDAIAEGLTDEEIAELGDKSPRYKYTI